MSSIFFKKWKKFLKNYRILIKYFKLLII